MQLSTNFSLAELTHTGTGLDNTPDSQHLAALKNLAAALERVRAEPLQGNPVSVNSAYRSAAVNAAVGGVPNSAHEQAHAADITCASFGSPYEVALAIKGWLEQNDIAFDQLIFERNIWVHYSPQNSQYGQRGEFLTFDGSVYTDGIHPI